MIYTPAQIEKIKELKTIDVESSFNEFLDEQNSILNDFKKLCETYLDMGDIC